MQSIFEYLDYRKFLRDFYEEKKKQNYFYSFRYMAQKIGMDHSLLVKVLLGKRHITAECTRELTALCSFSAIEAKYFETLVNFDKARSESQSKIYFEKLLSLKQHTSRQVEADHYEYFKKWYYAAIRSLLDFYEFDGVNYKNLGKKLNPRITENEAREAIELLEKLCFIKKNPEGFFKPCEAHVSTGGKWHSLAIKNYQKETIALSLSSLDRDHRKARDISSVTMSITKEGMEQIREIIKECRGAIIKRVDEMNEAKRDRVYQLNMQFIPLTQGDAEESDS
jgi:uncharacterized protein (TIGR02147 family)